MHTCSYVQTCIQDHTYGATYVIHTQGEVFGAACVSGLGAIYGKAQCGRLPSSCEGKVDTLLTRCWHYVTHYDLPWSELLAFISFIFVILFLVRAFNAVHFLFYKDEKLMLKLFIFSWIECIWMQCTGLHPAGSSHAEVQWNHSSISGDWASEKPLKCKRDAKIWSFRSFWSLICLYLFLFVCFEMARLSHHLEVESRFLGKSMVWILHLLVYVGPVNTHGGLSEAWPSGSLASLFAKVTMEVPARHSWDLRNPRSSHI